MDEIEGRICIFIWHFRHIRNLAQRGQSWMIYRRFGKGQPPAVWRFGGLLNFVCVKQRISVYKQGSLIDPNRLRGFLTINREFRP